MMLFKGSRYKALPEISTTDGTARTIRSKALRWIPKTFQGIPDIISRFAHTVSQTDRLDLLAYKYYGDPGKWWLICDANPKYALPTDLLDQSPFVREIFTLKPPESENKWAILIADLRELTGMHEVYPDVFENTLDLIYNEKELSQEKIIESIESKGFTKKSITKQERIGQKIIIPPNQIV